MLVPLFRTRSLSLNFRRNERKPLVGFDKIERAAGDMAPHQKDPREESFEEVWQREKEQRIREAKLLERKQRKKEKEKEWQRKQHAKERKEREELMAASSVPSGEEDHHQQPSQATYDLTNSEF